MNKMSVIQVSVKTTYIAAQSQPLVNRYVYAYTITIANQGDVPAQLISRHWLITDANEKRQEVQGVGVVGEQPVLQPGEVHQYVSGCNLKTDLGFMEGYYEMLRQLDNSIFHVHIPRFNLIASYRLN